MTLIDEDEESNDIGEFNIASFLIIDTLDKNDDDIGDDDLNWYILVKDENIGNHGYIGNLILRIYRRNIGGYFGKKFRYAKMWSKLMEM